MKHFNPDMVIGGGDNRKTTLINVSERDWRGEGASKKKGRFSDKCASIPMSDGSRLNSIPYAFGKGGSRKQVSEGPARQWESVSKKTKKDGQGSNTSSAPSSEHKQRIC